MNTDNHVVLPNRRNLWTGYFLFGGLMILIFILGFFKGVYLSSGLWKGTLALLIPLIWITIFIKAQRVVLSGKSILHTKLGFFKIVKKEFYFSELDCWKVDKLTLVIVKKDAKAPVLPHGFFEDVSQVILIPTLLYMPRTNEIMEYLTAHGVNEKARSR